MRAARISRPRAARQESSRYNRTSACALLVAAVTAQPGLRLDPQEDWSALRESAEAWRLPGSGRAARNVAMIRWPSGPSGAVSGQAAMRSAISAARSRASAWPPSPPAVSLSSSSHSAVRLRHAAASPPCGVWAGSWSCSRILRARSSNEPGTVSSLLHSPRKGMYGSSCRGGSPPGEMLSGLRAAAGETPTPDAASWRAARIMSARCSSASACGWVTGVVRASGVLRMASWIWESSSGVSRVTARHAACAASFQVS